MIKKISIDGMSCNHCVSSVRSALSECSGASVVDVTIGEAVVEIENGKPSDEHLKAAVEDIGFEVIDIK